MVINSRCWNGIELLYSITAQYKTLCSTAIASDQARLDIVATGLWVPFERTYNLNDVRITHPIAPSNVIVALAQLYLRKDQIRRLRVRESDNEAM